MIAVTGGRGFIGRAVVNELTARGEAVMVLDRPTVDIRESLDLGTCTGVIHLAGVLGTHELFDSVGLAVETNVGGTVNVLDAAVRAGARYVGITMPQVFPSIYTATKIGAGALETAYHHNYGLKVSRVRAFNAFGPHQAHGPGHPQKILPTFAVEAWAGRPIPIWGDGEQTVDLIHTRDLAYLLAEALHHGDNVTFDGGTGKALTVNQVAKMVLDITGSKAGVVHLPMRRGEVPTTIVAKGEGWERLNGWHPTWNEERFAEAVYWYRLHPLVAAA